VRFVDHRLSVSVDDMSTTRDLLLRLIKNYQSLARVHTACPIPPLCVAWHARIHKQTACHSRRQNHGKCFSWPAREGSRPASRTVTSVGPLTQTAVGQLFRCQEASPCCAAGRLKRRAEHKSSRICEAGHPPPTTKLDKNHTSVWPLGSLARL
jgi:hypothetical protein